MKRLNIQDLRALDPCYDPVTKLGETWQGTVLDLLEDTRVPAADRVWAGVRLVDTEVARRFAVACARYIVTSETDSSIINCIEVTERYLDGKATLEELNAAAYAAYEAGYVARSAVESVAYAARSAAYESASVAWSAVYAAYAARYAVESASAAWSAAAYEDLILFLLMEIEANKNDI